MKAGDPARSGHSPRLEIVPMVEGDIRTVLRIEARSFTTMWPANAFTNEVTQNKLAHYFVGKLDGSIVAYGGIWVILEDAHVTTIAVTPEQRGRRLGEQMLVYLIHQATDCNAAWITLEVRESNDVAQNLYKKYGFTTVSTRRGYYSDNSENALVMWAGNLKGELYRKRLESLEAALTRSAQ